MAFAEFLLKRVYSFESPEMTHEYLHYLIIHGIPNIRKISIVTMIEVVVYFAFQFLYLGKKPTIFQCAILPSNVVFIIIATNAILRKTYSLSQTKRAIFDQNIFLTLLVVHGINCLLITISIFRLPNGTVFKGIMIGIALSNSIFGSIEIFKSFRVSSVYFAFSFIILTIGSLSHQNVFEQLPLCLIIPLFLLNSMKQIDDQTKDYFLQNKILSIEKRKLSMCIDNSSIATIILHKNKANGEFEVDYYNPLWKKEPFNYTHEKNILDSILRHKTATSTIDSEIKALRMSLKSGNFVLGQYKTEFVKGATTHYFLIDISIVTDSQIGEIIAIQYKENTESIELAEQSIKQKMMNTITHEMLTPMNSILCTAMLLHESTQHVPEAKMLLINSKLLHLKIRDFILYSDSISGVPVINYTFTDVKSILVELYEMYVDQTKSKSIKFKLQIDDALPNIITDALKFTQLLSIIFSISAKFTESGEISILARDKEESLDIVLTDTGKGFIAINEPSKMECLGYAIAKLICFYLKITLSVSSIAEKGMRAVISCPHHNLNFSNALYQVPSERVLLNNMHKYQQPIIKRHFIIADDNCFNRQTLMIMLSKLTIDYLVYEAVNGKEAYNIFMSLAHKDIKITVWMDIDMPVMDGIESTKCILHYKQSYDCTSNVSVIGVTAFNTKACFDNCFQVGMKAVYTKPLSFSMIKECIANYINN